MTLRAIRDLVRIAAVSSVVVGSVLAVGPTAVGAAAQGAAATPMAAAAVPVDVSPVRVGYARGRVYGRGTDGRVWWRSTSASAWQPIAGLVGSGPAAVEVTPAGQSTPVIVLFARGPAGDLLTATQTGSVTSGWSSLGGRLTSAPSAMTTGAGYNWGVVVAVRGTDGSIWTKVKNFPSGSWSGWTGHGGRATSAPCVYWYDPGPILLAVRGTDGRRWNKHLLDEESWSWWSDDVAINSALAVNNDIPYGTLMAWRNSRNQLFLQTGAGPVNAGGYLTSAPEVSLTGTDQLLYQAFVRGGDNAVWQYARQSGVGTWTSLGGKVT
jgi:hypothetical protein